VVDANAHRSLSAGISLQFPKNLGLCVLRGGLDMHLDATVGPNSKICWRSNITHVKVALRLGAARVRAIYPHLSCPMAVDLGAGKVIAGLARQGDLRASGALQDVVQLKAYVITAFWRKLVVTRPDPLLAGPPVF